MKRLFMDSDGSPASSRLALHPCSSTLNRGVGTFASTRRAGRLCTVAQARHRMSGFTRVAGLERGQPLSLQYSWKSSLYVRLQPPTAMFSDWNASGHRSTRCCRPDRRDVVARPVWTAQQRTPSSGASRGTHGPWHQPGAVRFPRQSQRGRTSYWCLSGSTGEPEARANYLRSTRRCGYARPGVCTRPSGPRQAGGPMPSGTSQGAWGSTAKATCRPGRRGTTGEPDALVEQFTRTTGAG